MKKILLITLEFPPQIGGIASYTYQMANSLPRESVVVYAPKVEEYNEFDKTNNLRIYRKKPFYPFFIWPRWFRMFFQIINIVRKEKIEIIFINHVLPVGYVGYLIKKLFHTPYLIFSHGTDLAYASRNAWKTKMLKFVTKHARGIVFNSESLKKRALDIMPEFENKSLVVYPCPDRDLMKNLNVDELNLLKSQLSLDGKTIALSVSRFDEGKGLTHILRLLPKILEKVPNFVWLVVGDGPKKKQLFEFVQKNNYQNIVRFVGAVPHGELNKYYSLADFFILLTHPDEGREEGLGLVFLEAAAMRLPIIAGKSGGVEEAVENNKTGIVVDIHYDNQVISAIEKIVFDSEFSQKISQNAQKRIEENFQWEYQLAKLDKWLMDDKGINLKN